MWLQVNGLFTWTKWGERPIFAIVPVQQESKQPSPARVMMVNIFRPHFWVPSQYFFVLPHNTFAFPHKNFAFSRNTGHCTVCQALLIARLLGWQILKNIWFSAHFFHLNKPLMRVSGFCTLDQITWNVLCRFRLNRVYVSNYRNSGPAGCCISYYMNYKVKEGGNAKSIAMESKNILRECNNAV